MFTLYNSLLIIALTLVCQSCGFPTAKEAALQFETKSAYQIDENDHWREIGFASELINVKEKIVVVHGGDIPITPKEWASFKPIFPWKRNLDRTLHFDKTHFMRSPSKPRDCKGKDCYEIISYKGYTWLTLAQPIAVDFIPDKTDITKPEPGHLVIKTIKKCQSIRFDDHFYQLSDGKGNLYALHATEKKHPDLNVVLPKNYTLKKVALTEPLIINPFGNDEACYHNILGDHLGQGYHQYKYADTHYPSR
ncbi:MAG: hypothetical protein ACFB0B_04020 [Thermonemataceae bacterium]